jgi:cleavage and polyadenylation specificity factor subunit 1
MHSSNTKQRLYVTDNTTCCTYLIDSGATVSCLPATNRDKLNAQTTSLSAINTSGIRTWGTRTVGLTFNNRRFQQEFQICEVSEPLLGADFLAHHEMAIDFKTKRLLSFDGHAISCHASSKGNHNTVMGMHKDNPFDNLLAEFPELLVQKFTSSQKHGVEHYILTEGPPVYSKARRMEPDKLAAAEEEFRKMENAGIIRRSNSPWSSPLHMVKKVMDLGVHAAISDVSTRSLRTIAIRYHTFKHLATNSTVQNFFQRSTFTVATTMSQWKGPAFQRQQLLHHLVCLNL